MERLVGQVLFVVGREGGSPRTLRDLVEAALEGGVGGVELREKELPLSELLSEAEMTAGLVHAAGALLLINDRVDVALAVGADGVHLGLEDFPISWARRALGQEAIIGGTCRTARQAEQAAAAGASYVSAGPVFGSPTKPQLRPRGLRVVREIAGAVEIPVCAIGGITAQRVESVMTAGAALVAVSSAISRAEDVEQAARGLVGEVARCYSERRSR